ncbi:hypothetical protein A3715_19330 [Oleiphilus sp. HI0009]|nr:hypothetical protein A3715_19330 [Oleiphilus sp. HI0009]
MYPRNDFGFRLLSERKRLGFKQSEFAEKCGVTPVTQSRYEGGLVSPSATYIQNAIESGVNVLNLFSIPSNSDPEETKQAEILREAYILTDTQCRNDKGILLDLGARLEFFESYLMKLSG